MAKKKAVNPAEAYRKAQKQKEIKRNKAERKKAREEAAKAAEAAPPKRVHRPATEEVADGEGKCKGRAAGRTREIFGKDGKLIEPERSIYYDPVMNPYGVPPPGMPLRLKDESEDEDDGDEEDESGSDSDIVMPEGPPPVPPSPQGSPAEDSDDDIPMPEGPPPPKLPTGPKSSLPYRPIPPQLPPPFINPHPAAPPFFAPGAALPPPGFGQHTLPPPPPGMPHHGPLPPPPRRFFGQGPAPRGPAPMRQDPLSDVPHQPFQTWNQPPHPSLPPRPPGGVPMSVPPTVAPPLPAAPPGAKASATISAGPQLRDLKKEATTFVPAAIRKQQKEAARRSKLAGLGSSGISSAPQARGGEEDLDGEQIGAEEGQAAPARRADLLGALKSGGVIGSAKPPQTQAGQDDYERFVASMGDVL